MSNALDGDRVLVNRLAARQGDEKQSAEIITVLERTRKDAVGTLQKRGSFGIVTPDDLRLQHDIYVSDDAELGAKDGDKVVVSIDSYEDQRGAIQGTILQVLGSAKDPAVQTLAVAMSSGVRTNFPDGVAAEVTSGKAALTQFADREDLRSLVVFSIDPSDAKDFDDALHITELENGEIEVGVHIADVSHFVPVDGDIDREAFARGTSVYLVDRVIPMLPEELSEDLCSLRPNEDRLAFSCIMRLSEGAVVKSFRICETIIHSKHRLTYLDAQEIIKDEASTHALKRTLMIADTMAKKMSQDRVNRGAVKFNSVEVRVILDDTGRPINIVPRERFDAHKLIEEFMLLANRTVAKYMSDDSGGTAAPFISRIHEPPDREKIRQLAAYVRPFGFSLPNQDGAVSASDLNSLLDAVAGSEVEPIIEVAALRSMSKARYSVELKGHFGLSEMFYTHFTSPIRRYPDLIVHRLVKRKLAGIKGPTGAELQQQCDHLSERERVAVEAERASIKLKQVEYAALHLGESFAGVVVGVSRFGVFVQITDLLVEGLVHVRDMDDDFYQYDERAYALVGSRSGRRYVLGNQVRVLLAAANPETRDIDLVFEGIPSAPRRRKKVKKRRKR
jgi:ribonuclease R